MNTNTTENNRNNISLTLSVAAIVFVATYCVYFIFLGTETLVLEESSER